MDSLNNLNLSIPNMWEVRDVFNKVKSVMLNYTEMEAKVHDATNNEAWGASSTAMQEIAQATYNYESFNEIMPTIYKRFTDKEARYWRQIYKALVLLEYLVKNGSERVVDDARSHISMIKMMKNFHYVDDKGKDQGINVRNRAKELAELLSNIDLIKEERKKAKKNRNKYTGVGSEGGMSFSGGGGYGSGSNYGSSSGGRFEGFGSSSNHGNSSSFYDDERSTGRYEEPDRSRKSPSPEPVDSKPKKTARDLFDFGDEPVVYPTSNKKEQLADDDDWGDFANGDANDDFDDFQSAPITSKPTTTTATSTNTSKNNNIFDLLGEESFVSTAAATPTITHQQSISNNQSTMGTPILSFEKLSINSNNTTQQQSSSSNITTPSSATASMNGIWSSGSNLFSLDSLGSNNKPAPKVSQGPSMNSLKTTTINNDWSNWASSNTTTAKQATKNQQQSSVFDDLLSL